MRAFWLLLAFTLTLVAKDNFIFDYRNDPLTMERIERLEREIGEMKAAVISLREGQKKSAAAPSSVPAAEIKKLEASIAALKKEVNRLAAQKTPAQNGVKTQGGNEGVEALQTAIESVQDRLATLSSSTVAKGDLAPMTMQIDLLNEKLLSLELALRENYAHVQSGGLPFDRYLPVTKAHVEYFVMGLLIVLALLFLMLIVALGRGKRAEAKIAQLVKLYQSSNKKSDERK